MNTAATIPRDRATFLLVSQLVPVEIGQRIKQARNEKGLTQDDLSDLGSFSKRALQTWESGVVIPYRSLRELASLLNRPTNWFLYGRDSAEAPDDHWEELDRRLEALEAQVAESVGLTRRALELLDDPPADATQPARRRAK